MRIRLYGLLRDAAGRSAQVDLAVGPDDTVGSVLERLVTRYPRMRPLLYTSQGTLHPHVLIARNGRDVRDRQGVAEPVSPDDELALFPPGAGG